MLSKIIDSGFKQPTRVLKVAEVDSYDKREIHLRNDYKSEILLHSYHLGSISHTNRISKISESSAGSSQKQTTLSQIKRNYKNSNLIQSQPQPYPHVNSSFPSKEKNLEVSNLKNHKIKDDWINRTPSTRNLFLPALNSSSTTTSSPTASLSTTDSPLAIDAPDTNDFSKINRKVRKRVTIEDNGVHPLPTNRGSYIPQVVSSKFLNSSKNQKLPNLRSQLSSTNIILQPIIQLNKSKIVSDMKESLPQINLFTPNNMGVFSKFRKKKSKEVDQATTTKSFLSRQSIEIVQTLVRKSLNDSNILRPVEQQFEGCLCFIDISGFSTMCHKLTGLENERHRKNSDSENDTIALNGEKIFTIEDIARNINEYFGNIIKVIHKCGGDVIKCGGDSLEVFFEDKNLPLSEVCFRGVLCALEIQKRYPFFKHNGLELSLHIGISCGRFLSAIVGGYNDEYEYAVLGQQSFRNLAPAVDGAKSEQVAVTRECYDLLSQCPSFCENLFFTPIEGTTRAKIVNWNQTKGSLSKMIHSFKINKSNSILTPKIFVEMKKLLSESIQMNINSFQTEYMADVRRICSIFIDLSSCIPKCDNDTFFDASIRDSNLSLPLQNAVFEIQTILKNYQGVISQIIQDEKGIVLLAGFGIPPYFTKYDAARAVAAAMEINSQLKSNGIRHSIGIATGMTFYGTLGDSSRQIVTLISHRVNLAARLMAKAGNYSIFCDDTTKKLSETDINFSLTNSLLKVKGIKGEIQVFSPTGPTNQSIDSDGFIKNRPSFNRRIVNILKIRGLLIDKLKISIKRVVQQFCEHQMDASVNLSPIIFCKGTSGSGKSEIVWTLADIGRSNNFLIFYSSGTDIFLPTPFYIWNQILQQLSPQHNFLDEWSNTNYSHKDTVKLIVELLQEYISVNPRMMIIIRSLHLVDEWSLQVIHECLNRFNQNILFICSISNNEYKDGSSLKLLSEKSLEFIIPILNISETEILIKIECKCSKVDSRIVQLVHEKGMGKISFIQEIVHSLHKNRIIIVENDTLCTVDSKGLESFTIPQKVLESMTTNFDQLHIDVQFVYKVAAVLAYERSFRVAMLIEVFPQSESKNFHDACLEKLKLNGVLDINNKIATFRYKSQQAQSYRRMLKIKKCELHLQAANWLRNNEQNLTPLYDTIENEIAFHLIQAMENGEKSQKYCQEVMNYKNSSSQTMEAFGKIDLAIQHLQESILFLNSENCTLEDKQFYQVRAEQSIERMQLMLQADNI